MKTFFSWVSENNLELPVNPSHDPSADWENNPKTAATKVLAGPKGEKTTDEQRCRTGWSANYPPAYFSAQYPALWVAPRKATHALDGKHIKKS